MDWKFSGDRPVYQQIITTIQGAVLSGEYPSGTRIPSVRELAAEARVNPNTMQRALGELERQGLLVSSSTAGRYVTGNRAILEQLRKERLEELARECVRRFRAYGLSPQQAADIITALDEEE